MICMGLFMVGMLITAKVRVAKWKKEGIYDEVNNCRLSDEEIAERKERLEREAAEAMAKAEEKAEE